jgi:hypothetical protein
MKALLFAKNLSCLVWKGTHLARCFLPSVILNILKINFKFLDNSYLNILQLVVSVASISLSYVLYKSGLRSFNDSLQSHQEILKWKYWMFQQQQKTKNEVPNLNSNILLSKVLRLQKMNASYCQVSFSHMLLAVCSLIDAVVVFSSLFSRVLPRVLQTLFQLFYHIYPILFITSLLLIVKSLEYLFVSEFNRLALMSTSLDLIFKSLRDQIIYDTYLSSPPPCATDTRETRRSVSVFRSLLELQPFTSLLDVYECSMILCDQCPDLLLAETAVTDSESDRTSLTFSAEVCLCISQLISFFTILKCCCCCVVILCIES